MFKITTSITDLNGTQTINLGTANTRAEAQKLIDAHFHYMQHGADSIDYELRDNVQIVEIADPAPKWHTEPATARQCAYLRDLGVIVPFNLTKKQASDLIEENKYDPDVTCHECGGGVINGRCVVCGGTDMVW